MANAQIAWLGWREGMTAEAAREYIHEGLELARETDDSMVPMLLFADGRIILASGGSADIYVERVKEALSLLKQSGNRGRIATLNCALSQAYGWAGLLKHALAASDAALQGLPYVERFDHEFLGYNVEHWVLTLRARILVRLGRLAEGQRCLDDLLKIEPELSDPTVQFIPHLGYVDLAWSRGDADLAATHAHRICEIGEKTGIPYLRVYGFACTGTAKALAKDFESAVREFVAGLQFMHQAKASMGFEAEVLASLAEAYLRLGQVEQASKSAAEAIEISKQRATRLAECRASIVRAAAVAACQGPDWFDEVELLFRRAQELIEMTGAGIYAPLLSQEREKLAASVI
jgi:adenylate cyclase